MRSRSALTGMGKFPRSSLSESQRVENRPSIFIRILSFICVFVIIVVSSISIFAEGIELTSSYNVVFSVLKSNNTTYSIQAKSDYSGIY